MTDEVAKVGLAIAHAYTAVMVAVLWPTPVGVTFAALAAFMLVFY